MCKNVPIVNVKKVVENSIYFKHITTPPKNVIMNVLHVVFI